jgi:dipeptidyl aminopeptidase/acylaminoacyl peptidase
VLRVLRAAAAAGAILSAISLAAREGWEDRYRLTRRGLVAFAERAPERLLLTSNESGAFQLETRDLSTGEKHVLTAGAAGRTAGAIAPDGKFVYYVEDPGGSEVGSWVRVPFEGGDARPVAPGVTGSSTGIAFDPAGRFVVIGTSGPEGFRFDRIEATSRRSVAAAGGNGKTLYRSKNEAYGPALSADGKYLSLVETERKNDRHYATLILDAATGRRVAELWDGEGNSVTAGRWSPIPGDERVLVASDATGFLRPAIYDARSGKRAPVAPDLTGEVTAEDWSADARTVLLKSHAAGRDRIFRRGFPSTKSEPLEAGEGSIGSCGFRPGGSVWAMFQNAAVTPRLVELDRKGGRRTIFASDDAPAGTPLAPVDYPGGGGEYVPALLGIPAQPNGAAIVWLHGGPHSETADTFSPALQAYLDAGYTVLAPNYHGSSGLGRKWANSVVGDPMRLELEDFRGARDYLLGRKLARPDAIFIAGWSYGGYGVLSALTRQAELWAGGIAGAPITDFSLQYEDARAALRGWTVMLFGGTPEEKPALYRDRSPLAHSGGIRAPLLILAGKNDRRAPARQVEAFVAKLQAMKKEVTVRWFDAGHGSLASDEQIGEMKDSLAFLRKAMR